MKYSFMSFSCPSLSLDELLATAKRFGYDGIEPRVDSEHGHGIEVSASADARKVIKAKAEDSGIALCCIATSCRYADPSSVDIQIDATHKLIDLAGDVDSPRIRVFGGALPDGVSREQAIDALADAMLQVADHAAGRGVSVCMETHDDWSDPRYLTEVMKRVNHPAIAVNWDIIHPYRKDVDMDTGFDAVRPWINHVHFHDGIRDGENIELCHIGQGMVDHRRAIQLLQSIGYDGYMSGEWINWKPCEDHLPAELAAMKAYEEQLE